METAAAIYVGLFNRIINHLSRTNPKLSEMSFAGSLNMMTSAGVSCTTSQGLLHCEYSGQVSPKVFLDAMMSYIEAFERQYGINETWMPLKVPIIQVMQGCRDEVRNLEIEVPLAKYGADYSMLDNLFGFSASDFRNRRWIKGTALVTNLNLQLAGEANKQVIPLQAIATIDREIYVGYSSEVTRGIIRAIDYQITATGMSSIIILAKKEVMKDLMRVITIARTEYRRLDQPEANVLIAMYNGVKTEDIPKALSMQTDDANKCIRRLMRIGYSDPKGHLTSYGINAVIELMRTAKWQGGSQ